MKPRFGELDAAKRSPQKALKFSDGDRAVSALEAAVSARTPDIIGLGVDPTLDELRGTGRFDTLLKRLALG